MASFFRKLRHVCVYKVMCNTENSADSIYSCSRSRSLTFSYFLAVGEKSLSPIKNEPCDVVDKQRASGAAVVRASDGAEALLPGRIPNLKLNFLAANLLFFGVWQLVVKFLFTSSSSYPSSLKVRERRRSINKDDWECQG
jgi:hypothetical protein